MMHIVLSACRWPLVVLCCMATLYAVVAAVATPFLRATRANNNRFQPYTGTADGVSVLKPLCGDEPRLYENLATFCEQTHPRFQILFGVSSPGDAAIPVVRRLQAAYPSRDIELAIDSRVHGCNLKVSNLINMAERAKYDVIVIADSDIAVNPDYLSTVSAPLADPGVGVVTCLYVAQSVGGFWPRIGALFITSGLLHPCGWRTQSAPAGLASGRRSRCGALRSSASAASMR